MGYLINDVLARYASSRRPLMVIASRNQVDHSSGYVMTLRELAEQFAPYRGEHLMLCRDHCGPYFLDSEKHLSLADAVEATKKTIAADIEHGFNLIHIDTSRCEDHYKIAEELMLFSLKLNPLIKFEFGTEENVGVAASLVKYKDDVKFASQFPNMEFVVAQTGSLTYEDRQAGTFYTGMVRELVDFANQAGVKLKEHNADYLSSWQIALRKKTGVHACNIAPQLGVIQTRTVLNLAEYYEVDSDDFRNTVISSNRWTKWTNSDNNNVRVAVAGHYCFNTPEYRSLEDKLGKLCNVQLIIENSIVECLEAYYTNLY